VRRKFQSKGGRDTFDPHERFFQELRVHAPGIGADCNMYIINLGQDEFSVGIYAGVEGFEIDHKEYGGKG